MAFLDRRLFSTIALGAALGFVLADGAVGQLDDLTSEWVVEHRDIVTGLGELSNASLIYNAASEYSYLLWFCATPPLEAEMPSIAELRARDTGPGVDGPPGPPPFAPRIIGRGRHQRVWHDGREFGRDQRRGCGDPIYHARSKDGVEWEVYGRDGRWTTPVRPWAWQPVVDRGDAWYDSEYAAHPSVVVKDGVFYMAYSSLGLQPEIVQPGRPGYWTSDVRTMETIDGDFVDVEEPRWVRPTEPQRVWYVRACIMGARSTDGIHWAKTPGPIAIAPTEPQGRWTADRLAGPLPRNYQGAYQRPSLLFDEGRWRLWYAYYWSGDSVAMGYRENRGDFMQPEDWDRGFATTEETPLLTNWPNPSVVRVFDKYYAFSDRGRYSRPTNGGAITMAESDDGFRWHVTGVIRPEGEMIGVGEPEASFVEDPDGAWLRVFYSCDQAARPGTGPQYSIRAMTRQFERRLLVPRLVCDWRHAIRLVDFSWKIDSFSLFGMPGRWYCMGVDPGKPDALFLGVNDCLTTIFSPPEPAAEPFLAREQLPGGLNDATRMCGPFVRLLDPVTPLLCYAFRAAQPPAPAGSSIRMLSLGRDGWKPYGPQRPLGTDFLFQEDDLCDPVIIWDPAASVHVMYYVGAAGGALARTSPDLVTWSEPRTVVECPPGYGTAEAPFVVHRQGYYYLFVSSEDHTSMAVYASLDPLNFGDAERDQLTELPGHAPEIVRADGVDYIACCSIRTGSPPGDPELEGIYLQELDWVE